MIKRNLVLILWLCLSAACSRPGATNDSVNQHGLNETINWLKLKLPIYATDTTTFSDNGEAVRKFTWLDSKSPCTLSWQTDVTLAHEGHKIFYKEQTVETAPLDKIDNKLSEVRHGEAKSNDTPVWELFLHTVDQERVIDYDTHAWFMNPSSEQKNLNHLDSASLTFTNPEIVNRIKAAFDHAAGLCSKRPSEPF